MPRIGLISDTHGLLRPEVVVAGHSHQPSVEERNGVLYVNPGSAGPRRFKLPIAVAELEVVDRSVKAKLVELRVGSAADLRR